MAQHNVRHLTPSGATKPSPFTATPGALTHEAGPGTHRDPRLELFLIAAGSMVNEASFYETADDRVARFRHLVATVAIDDPVWCAEFLRWLRHDANIRTAAVMGAAEYVHARLVALDTTSLDDGPPNRQVIRSVLARGDEPGELVAYWMSQYGRNLPVPVKRGVADAMIRLGTEMNFAKWDSAERGIRWADLLNLTHPGDRRNSQHFRGQWQKDLFEHIVAKPYRPDTEIPGSLGMLTRRQALLELPVEDRRRVLDDPDALARAGITWEALAGWLQGPMDAHAWAAIIPAMGLMAQVRNLRNFDQAGVTDDDVTLVLQRLVDRDEVRRSRMFPYRFYTAHRETAQRNLRWGYALEVALQHSLANLPALGGRTLVLVDTSRSMLCGVSGKSTVSYADIAALFGVALAVRGENVDLVGFADHTFKHPVIRGGSVLIEMARFVARIGEVGLGTRIGHAVELNYRGHDRVVVISDMQTMPHQDTRMYVGGLFPSTEMYGCRDVHGSPKLFTELIPRHVPVYGFTLSGYQAGAMHSGVTNRYEFGGLTDSAFRVIPLLEAGHRAAWPWNLPASPVEAA